MLACWLGEGIPALVAANVLVAFGDGFRSGADDALLFRTCVVLDCEDAFQKIEARTRTIELGALVAMVLAGGVIVGTWGFAVGWAAEVIGCASGFAIACAMLEPPAHPADADVSAPAHGGGFVARASIALILPAAFLGAAAGMAAFVAQTSGTSDPERLTWLVAMISLSEAAGCALAARLPPAGLYGQLILGALGLLLVMISLVLPLAFPVVVLGLAFLVGVAAPLRATAIQRLAADNVRARAASLASTCDMALMTIALPLAGLWRR